MSQSVKNKIDIKGKNNMRDLIINNIFQNKIKIKRKKKTGKRYLIINNKKRIINSDISDEELQKIIKKSVKKYSDIGSNELVAGSKYVVPTRIAEITNPTTNHIFDIIRSIRADVFQARRDFTPPERVKERVIVERPRVSNPPPQAPPPQEAPPQEDPPQEAPPQEAPPQEAPPLLQATLYLQNPNRYSNEEKYKSMVTRIQKIKNISEDQRNALLNLYLHYNMNSNDSAYKNTRARIIANDKPTIDRVIAYSTIAAINNSSSSSSSSSSSDALASASDDNALASASEDDDGLAGEGKGDSKAVGPGISNVVIDKIMKKDKNYIGCFGVNQLGEALAKVDTLAKLQTISFIVNTQPFPEPGHWVAVRILRSGGMKDTPGVVEYYDSFGAASSIPKDIMHQISKILTNASGMYQLKINQVQVQSKKTDNCGMFATRFLLDRAAGDSFKKATHYDVLKKVLDESEQGEKDIKPFRDFVIKKFIKKGDK